MFRQLDETISVAPQISTDAVAAAAQQGVKLIINNRPDGESEDQTEGDAIEAAARSAGIDYVAIPVTHAGFSEWQVTAMSDALANATGPVLAYCRSGTRSTLLWALSQAAKGEHPAVLSEKAARAGYDLSSIGQMMDMLRPKPS
jgi:uncharacterized protein (TIGR01244 family)